MDLTAPYTADNSGLDPDFDTLAIPATIISYADESQRKGDLPWSVNFIGNNNGDLLMEPGEKAEITVWLMDRDNAVVITGNSSVAFMDTSTANGGGVGGLVTGSTLIGKSTRFVIEMTPQIGAALTIQRTVPPGLRQVMNLN